MNLISDYSLMKVERTIDRRSSMFKNPVVIKKILIILIKQRFKVKDLKSLSNGDVDDVIDYVSSCILSGSW
jgi:hypothetical protein